MLGHKSLVGITKLGYNLAQQMSPHICRQHQHYVIQFPSRVGSGNWDYANGAFPLPDSDSFTDIGTDIDAKLGTVAIGIGIRIGIGIGLGSVETVLHIIIEPNFIGIGNGIGVGIGVGQWKCTIRGTWSPWPRLVINKPIEVSFKLLKLT